MFCLPSLVGLSCHKKSILSHARVPAVLPTELFGRSIWFCLIKLLKLSRIGIFPVTLPLSVKLIEVNQYLLMLVNNQLEPFSFLFFFSFLKKNQYLPLELLAVRKLLVFLESANDMSEVIKMLTMLTIMGVIAIKAILFPSTFPWIIVQSFSHGGARASDLAAAAGIWESQSQSHGGTPNIFQPISQAWGIPSSSLPSPRFHSKKKKGWTVWRTPMVTRLNGSFRQH